MKKEDPKAFSLLEQIGKVLPLVWEPVANAPLNIWPVAVTARNACDCDDCKTETYMLAGGRFGGEWSFTLEPPKDVVLIDFFRLPIPPHILKARGN